MYSGFPYIDRSPEPKQVDKLGDFRFELGSLDLSGRLVLHSDNSRVTSMELLPLPPFLWNNCLI